MDLGAEEILNATKETVKMVYAKSEESLFLMLNVKKVRAPFQTSAHLSNVLLTQNARVLNARSLVVDRIAISSVKQMTMRIV